MKSKSTIKSELQKIASANNLTGDSIDMIIDMLTYSLYHEQVEIANAMQESSLSTAYSLNSKIQKCMDVMYSVYRGRCPRVRLTFQNSTNVEYDKFDKLYSANSFNVYAEDSIQLSPSTDDTYNSIYGIIASSMITMTSTVTIYNQYYIDLIDNSITASNISEDILVYINGTQYPTTRNFYDHLLTTVSLTTGQYYSIINSEGITTYYIYIEGQSDWITVTDLNDSCLTKIIDTSSLLDKGELSSTNDLPDIQSNEGEYLFVLTIPGYGIRLFKKGFFQLNDVVTIKALKYTELDSVTDSELSNIQISGTNIVTDLELSKSNIVSKRDDMDVIKSGTDLSKSLGFIQEISRETSKSLLYNANVYSRLQGSLVSNSDINVLFNEYFYEKIKYSTSHYHDNNIFIYYIPRIGDDTLLVNTEISKFINKYKSYYINTIDPLNVVAAVKCLVKLNLELVVTSTDSLQSKIESLLSNYEYRIHPYTDETSSIYNEAKIKASINKLDNVEYINEYTTSVSIDGTAQSESIINLTKYKGIPTYYVFELNITTEYSYENISD